MEFRSISAAMAAANREVQVVLAETADDIIDAHRLRHQVYCLERGYEAGEHGLEIDKYDDHSRHVLLRRRACGQAIGTARLIMPAARPIDTEFPMLEVCRPSDLSRLPLASTAEVSRFALSRDRHGLSNEAAGLSRLMLVRGLVMLSQRTGVTHWAAMMERTLLRLLRASSIHFSPLGPEVEYHGLRQPASCCVSDMLERMEEEQPAMHAFIHVAARPAHSVAAGRRMAGFPAPSYAH